MIDTAKRNADAAAVVVETIASGRHLHAVVSPGSRSTPLALACAEHPRISVHPVVDERAAAFIALGIARATAEPTVLVCSSGSAGAHYLPAVVEASAARVPLIIMTADRPAELHGVGAPQTMPQSELYRSFVRRAVTIAASDGAIPLGWIADRVAECAVAAASAPMGPVHLNIQFREPLWRPDVAASPVAIDTPLVAPLTRAPFGGSLAELAARLSRSLRGLFVCGPAFAASRVDVADAVSQLAAKLGWPVIADGASGLRFRESADETTIATGDALVRARAWADEHKPDVIVRLGLATSSTPMERWFATTGAEVWQIDGAALNRLAPSVVIDADAASVLGGLAAELSGHAPKDPTWLASWRAADARASELIARECADGTWEGAIARAVVERSADEAIVFVGSSMPIRDVDGMCAGGRSRRVESNRGVNGIDGAVATALGLSVGAGRPVVALLGDLTLLHDVDGLACAARAATDLTVVVVENGGGGIFSFLPIAEEADHFDSLFYTPHRLDVGSVVRGFGASFVEVDGCYAAVGEALSRTGGGLTVISAVVDRDTNVDRHRRLWREVEARLTSLAENEGRASA